MGCNFVAADTSKQKLYGALADYKQVQELAIAYKEACEAKVIPSTCNSRLVGIRQINDKANILIQSIHPKNGEIDYSDFLINSFILTTIQLGNYLKESPK